MKTNITAILLAAGLMVGCNETSKEVDSAADVGDIAAADTAVMYEDVGQDGRLEADGAEINTLGEGFWANIDFDAPVIDNPELSKSGVEMRGGSDGYNIYTMDERILFDLDKAQLRAGADDKLQAIASAIKEVSSVGPIRVFGHTDSLASKSYNKELAAERANTVKEWLQSKGGIDASRISIQAVGEAKPIATNATARGRQLNRRVAVVVATRE